VPELPEVETIARGLARELVGETLGAVLAARSDYVRAPPPSVEAHLHGRRVVEVCRRGKRLSLRLSPAGEILLHLGMSGRVTVASAADVAAPHTHLRVALGDGSRELRMQDPRRFGGVWIRGGPDGALPPAGRNGARPDALGPDALDVDRAALRALLARPRGIKALLLDQRVIAGLGNIYVDEILWAARIHPRTPASTLGSERVAGIHRHLRRILLAAIAAGGSTIRDYRAADGQRGRFQERHRVWGREGRPCGRCGALIRRLLVAGRSTHVCPRCQRAASSSRRRALA
jgi:formamidopyrimidine-DNA glycosylase